MATSPNYGWLEPDNTDLVKNGALSIRTLGNAIDTTMATMTPKSTYTAKGSIAAATAASTPANLAVGNNGETLVADSSTSTGLRYQGSMAAARNAIINGGFDIWQRGTSIAVNAAAYTTDRWIGLRGVAGMTVSRQTTSDTTNLPFIQYCARVQRDSGNTSTTTLQFASPIETANGSRYSGQTVTLSFYARAGANYSATSNALAVYLSTGTGTDGNPMSGYTGQANAISSSATLTTTWQRFNYSVTLGSTITQIAPYFVATPTGTAGANDYFEMTAVQLELGSVATQFTRTGGTIQGELSACQRYYERNTANSTATSQDLGTLAYANGTTSAFFHYFYKVTKRVTPSFASSGTFQLTDAIAFNYAITGLAINTSTSNETLARLNVSVASGLVAKGIYFPQSNATATSYIEFSAEL